MYTVVLMAALTTSSSTPEFGRHSCTGNAYGACHGCSGVGHTCRGRMGHGGACVGANCACYGGYGVGCYGAWVNPHSVWYAGHGCTGCYGAYGGYSCYGIPVQPGVNLIGPPMGAPLNPGPIPPIEVTPKPKVNKPEEQTRAKVRIEIPADAKLFVDGMLMKTTSAVRMFQTPVLEPNQTYVYELKAEVIRNNQTYTDVQQLVVRPGEQASASFAGLELKAAAAAVSTPATAQR